MLQTIHGKGKIVRIKIQDKLNEQRILEPGILREKPKLSVCMIVRDEEKSLPRCLKSVKGVADELVILDTGSEDNTISIAKNFGASIFHFAWSDDYAAARNEALKHVTGDWILQIDADEELPDSSVYILKKAVLNPWCLLYVMTCHEIHEDKEYQRFSPVPRLFRNHPSINYSRPYHEMVNASVRRIMRTEPRWQEKRIPDLIIHHYGYPTSDVLRKKSSFALRIMKSYIEENPGDSYILLMLGELYYRLGHYDETIVCIEEAKTLISFPDFGPGLDPYSDLPSELPPWFNYVLGCSYYRKELYYEAIGEFETVLDVDPFFDDASERLSLARNAVSTQKGVEQGHENIPTENARAFEEAGKMTTESLIQALHDSDWSARRKAAMLLSDTGDISALEALVELLNDEYGDRIGAAWALGGIKDAKATQPLIEALRDEDWYPTWGIRWAAARALVKIGRPAVESLVKALSDDDKGIRWGAAWALGRIKDGRATEALVQALQDDDDCVRLEAVRALGILRPTWAVEPLLAALKDKFSGVRREAARSLGKIGSMSAREALSQTLKDSEEDVQKAACKALDEIT